MIILPTTRGVLRKASVGPSTAHIWIDPSDLSSMRQEITGASATTAVAVGDPVGSIFNKGTVGAWLTAPSTAARPVLRQASGFYYLEQSSSSQQMAFATAISNVIYNSYFNLTYAAYFDSTGTLIGGSGTGTGNNLHLGLGGGSQIIFAYFGANLGGPTSQNAQSLVVSNMLYSGGRTIRRNGVLVAGDSSTQTLTNSVLNLFIGPLGFGGGTNRFYGMVARQGSVPISDRIADEQFLAAKIGLSFTSEIIPLMTSDTAPYGHSASASSTQQSAYLAFNGVWSSSGNDVISLGGSAKPWNLDRQFPEAITVRSYRLIQHTDANNSNWNDLGGPTEWTIQGSNNGSSWTVLDSRTGEPFSIGTQTTYTLATPGSYRYYRMNVTKAGTAGASNGYIIFAELTYYT